MSSSSLRFLASWVASSFSSRQTAGALLFGFAVCLSPALATAQSAWIGQTPEALIAVVGAPASKASMGAREIWTYDNGTTVHFREGKIERVRGSLPAPPPANTTDPSGDGRASTVSNPSPAPAADSVQRMPPRPVAPPSFRAPAATIVTDPEFRVNGTWGGLSDGKTIGADGKPLAAHQLYANDCIYFERRMMRGLRESMGADAWQRVQDLRGILKLASDSRAQNAAAERYALRWRQAAWADRLRPFAESAETLHKAQQAYQEAIGHLDNLEQVRASDRIDLAATNVPEEGLRWRAQARQAIGDLETARAQWLSGYRRIYEIGQAAELAEFRAAAAN